MPRFVILEHDWPTRHWDFLLEAGTVLRAWRLAAEPAPGQTIDAQRNFDHRLLYLEFEGSLTGNRGHVKRTESGTFDWLVDTQDEVVLQIRSSRLIGRVLIANGFARFTSE